jgi:putative DNA primase/helicase
MTADDLLLRLEGVHQAGTGWQARCPAHDDQRASLHVAKGDNGGILLHCHAGCEPENVVRAIGVTMADLMPTPNTPPKEVAIYDYHDESGQLLYQVVRMEPKDFRQRAPKPSGGWNWSTKGVRRVPYRLPALLANPAAAVYIVEGEKDVDNLAALGCVATCNAGGAGKWTAELSKHLAGRQVIVLPDNDEPGRKHGQQVAASLAGTASRVKIVELPGLPNKGDVSDWLAKGGTLKDLERLAGEAQRWEQESDGNAEPVLVCLADVEPRPVSWLWPGRIPLGRITLLVGRPGEGKSFLTTDMAARITTATPWPDGSECPIGSVVLISAEDDPADTIRPRLDAHYADVRRVHLLSAVRRKDADGHHERMVTLADLDAIEKAVKRCGDCKLIVVDPIGSFLGGRTDSHRDNEVRAVLAPIAQLAERHGPAVLVVAHRRKGTGSTADDLALGSRAFTGIARAVWHK